MTTSPHTQSTRRAVVTGATGFVGLWLVAELTRLGVPVVALVRSPERRRTTLQADVSRLGGRGSLVDTAPLDLDAADLGLDDKGLSALRSATEVYHLAARFGFGLERDVAHQANVTAAVQLVATVAGSAHLTRFVHISGYRTRGTEGRALDVDNPAALDAFYQSHGAYEASKLEAHQRVATAAADHGVPLTRVSPAMVIGDSRTGETTQLTGLADVLQKLWDGQLPALVGSVDTWIPVVAVDILAALLARLPTDPTSEGDHILVLDDRTPSLLQVVQRAATRMGRSAPRLTLPVPVVRALPEALSGVHPEALSFVSADRYDTATLRATLRRLGIEMPDVVGVIDRWVDHLVDTRFGARAPSGGRTEAVGGTRVWLRGTRDVPENVFLHGVLLDGDSWGPVRSAMSTPALVPDLPGLGLSAPGGGSPEAWMTSLLAPVTRPVTLVGHSLGTAFALAYAAAHPDRVERLVLVSPFFLQARASWALRQPALFGPVVSVMPRASLAEQVGGPHPVLDHILPVAQRFSVARRHAGWLARASSEAVRAQLTAFLDQTTLPVDIVVGEHDPLRSSTRHPVTVIPGTGHYPQLTHPEAVAAVVSPAPR